MKKPAYALWVRCASLWGTLILVFLGGQAAQGADSPETVLGEIPGPEWSLQATLTGPTPWPDGATAWLRWQLSEKAYEVVLQKSTAQLFQRQGEVCLPLTSPAALPPGGSIRHLTWQSRADHLALIVGGRVVIQGGWVAPAGGGSLILGTSRPDLTWSDSLLQPYEEIYFRDDFMRRPEQAGGWEPLLGNWALSSLDEHQYATAARSANPFTYQTHLEPQQTALTAIGYWFWSDYAAAASVRAEGWGQIGLAVFLQDDRHYLLFRWSAGPASGVAQWVRVSNGTERVLAERSGGYVPKQWYRLRVEAVPGQCAAFIDGQPLLHTSTDDFGQGRMALFARSGEKAMKVDFDDVEAETCEAFEDDFADSLPGRWREMQGRWQRGEHGLEAQTEGENLTVAGLPEWSRYVVEATLEVPEGATAGLLFAGRSATDYGLLRVGPAGAELDRVQEGTVTVLDSAKIPGEQRGVRPLRMAVQLRDGYNRAFVEGAPILETWVPALPEQPGVRPLQEGWVGLYADRPGVRCTRFAVCFPPSPERDSGLGEEFAKDQYMHEWATSAGEWLAQPDGSLWHKGWLIADPVLEFPVPSLGAGQSLVAAIAAQPDGSGGYRLTLGPAGEGPASRTLVWRLARQEETVLTGIWETLPSSAPPGERLRLVQQGSWVGLLGGDRVLAIWRDPAPLRGSRVLLHPHGITMDPAQAHAECAAMTDDAFSHAPVEWWVQRGEWTLAQRWTCSAGGQWTFFGGTSDIAPILWSKRDFDGDQVFEFYAAAAVSGRNVGRLHDLNAVLCGDGANLDSGYTIILGGQQGHLNRLLRQGQVLAESAFQLPDSSSDWPAVRIEKIGPQIRCYLNGAKVLEAIDPEPLPGGKFGLWTFNGSLLVARARLWAERLGEGRAIPVLERSLPPPPSTGPLPVRNDFEEGLGACSLRPDVDETLFLRDPTTAAEGQFSLKVTNGVSGGFFPLWLSREAFDLPADARLEFAYRVPPEVKVNFYLRLQGEWWELTFTGPGRPQETKRWLGEIPGIIADNQWHRATFEVGMALQRVFPNGPPYRIDQMALASRREGYLWCGLGANPLGATYWLDDLQVGTR